MPTVLVNDHTGDYDHWRNYFDDSEDVRKKYGVIESRVFRGTDDPNEALVLMECEDLEKMREMAEDPEFIEVVKQGGVDTEASTSYILQEVEQ